MSKTFALDGFEPIKRIGGGGFGDVWLARQTNVDRKVAVKVGHAPIQDKIIRLRFERECKALGRLSGHPNIVDVFTAGSLDDGRPYLVLEYIDGGTLWQRLKRAPVSEDELIDIGEQLAGALAEAHSAGVLHRDLKPENILMRSNGDSVLGDFGIARLQDGVNTTSAAITASVAYAAPEVLGGTKASAASDLYGIGVCLLAAILRSVPFVDKSDKSIHPIITRVMSDQPPDLRSHGVSEDLAKIVESLLHKDPSRRPDSATDVRSTFQALRDGPWQNNHRLLDRQHDPADISRSTEVRRPPDRAATRRSRALDSGFSGFSGSVTSSADAPSGGSSADEQRTTPDPHSDGGPSAGRPESATRDSRADSGPPLAISALDGTPDSSASAETSNNVRAFAIAYVATLSAGAVLIYLLARLLG